MIDSDGFRPNVGIIVCNDHGQVLWARRARQSSWQFPQGGIDEGETAETAMYRELYEEVGLERDDVEVLACTRNWLRYKLPSRLIRRGQKPLCIGQKQRWYLLKLVSDDSKVNLKRTAKPEFDHWEWVSWWYPLRGVVNFKRDVYRKALKELIVALEPTE